MAKEKYPEKKSKTDIAYQILLNRKNEMDFYDLWEAVKKNLGDEADKNIDEDISFFYTNLTLDGRFWQSSVGNKWQLRERTTFNEIKQRGDLAKIYDDSDVKDEEQAADEDYDGESLPDSDRFDDPSGSDAEEIQTYRERGIETEEEDKF